MHFCPDQTPILVRVVRVVRAIQECITHRARTTTLLARFPRSPAVSGSEGLVVLPGLILPLAPLLLALDLEHRGLPYGT